MPHFKRHHKIRMDRKEKKGDAEAEEDDDHLGKSGGCFLLSSNQVPIELVEKDSNGNVEYIIAEVPSIHTAVILIYNPGSNFALDKFKEVMGPVNKYLNKNSQRESPMEIILTGDLNFDSDIVTWDASDMGVTPNPKNGEGMPQKKGFRILSEIAELHHLTQLVDKVTHGNEILDILYSSNPSALSQCKTRIIKPHSDHEMVSFTITANSTNCVIADGRKYQKDIPEVATYNYGSANEVNFNAALADTNWIEELGPASNIKFFGERFANCIVNAAQKARVPKFKQNPGTASKEKGDKNNKHTKSETQRS